MSCRKLFLISVIFLFGGILSLMAQEQRQTVVDATTAYMQTSGNSSALYNGEEYEKYLRTTNHPYLADNMFVHAQLSYQNVLYPDVLLRYDMHKDKLVIQSPNLYEIVLFDENVEFAEMFGKHIFYFQKDTIPGCPPSGYYILLHAGNSKVMEKRNASLVETAVSGSMLRYFIFSTRYYLFMDGEYFMVKNKQDFLKILSPYKKELKRFISTRHLNFKKDAETFLIHTMGEYEQLSGRR